MLPYRGATGYMRKKKNNPCTWGHIFVYMGVIIDVTLWVIYTYVWGFEKGFESTQSAGDSLNKLFRTPPQ